MAAKKRVYDLAKGYGMTGQELAAKLRDLGFAHVKSHMTALSDFEVLEITGRLEAYGIVNETHEEADDGLGGLKIKRKMKTRAPVAPPEDEAPATDAASAPTPKAPATQEEVVPKPRRSMKEVSEASRDGQPDVVSAEHVAEVGSEAPAQTPKAAPTPTGAEASPSPAPIAPESAPVAKGEPPVDEARAPLEVAPGSQSESARPDAAAASLQATEAQAGASPEVETAGTPPTSETAEAPKAARRAEPPTPAAGEVAPKTARKDPGVVAPAAGAARAKDPDSLVRPSSKRRTGKVVGFIDPAQFERKAPAKPQSRRLRSSDDVVPDVRPTFGRSPSTGQVRGDQTRGSMTAQELREREASRFLRRRRPPQQGGGGRRRPGGGGRDDSMGGGLQEAGNVQIVAPITLKKLANTLAVKENQVFQVAIRQMGFGITINSTIDEEAAILLAHEFNIDLEVRHEIAAEEQLMSELRDKRDSVEDEQLVQRAPCVAFLGHVDHGKTTLIDSIRSSRLADRESGGITQHIGAYQVTTQKNHTLCVVDTPGHAAFSAMRARGARAVDVVVLVVAADDSVKPQTEEAINHARAAKTPIVVAINKMDKPEANPERVRNELAGLGLTPEEWGGDTAMLEVSGLKGTGVEELLERVFLESEVLELKSHLTGPASGVVLEAEIQQGKGKVAYLIVQDGVLKRGDVILAGKGYGRVRSIHDDRGNQIPEAGPAMPVEVTGLNELPTVGDKFHVVESLDRAQEVADERSRAVRINEEIERRPKLHQNILDAVAYAEKTSINLIVKADMQGSVEVLKDQIGNLEHDEMEVKIVHSGVGAVLESDVDLAITSDSRILAFHTSAQSKVRLHAERNDIEIKTYEVIYEILDDIRDLMEGSLAPEVKEEVLGHVEIRRLFKSSKLGNICGSYVLDGKVTRSAKIRLLRDSTVVHTGSMGSLRREADDTKEVKAGFECGIVLKDYDDVRVGDVIEAYRLYEVKRKL